MKRLKNTTAKNNVSNVLSKVIAVLVLFLVLVVIVSEVMAFTVYGIPLLSTLIAKTQGVGMDAEWLLAIVLWGFPSLFITLLMTALHVWAIYKIVRKVWYWVKAILVK